jgi:hypothetical protein
MPAAKKSERAPKLGDRVRVFVDASMIDEPAEIIRVGRDSEIGVHLWPDSPERTALSGVQWFADEAGAVAHGQKGAWPE